jgi:hypothetical protein
VCLSLLISFSAGYFFNFQKKEMANRLVDLLEARKLGRRVSRTKFEGAMESQFNSHVTVLSPDLSSLDHPLVQPTATDYPLQPEIVLSTIAIAISSDGCSTLALFVSHVTVQGTRCLHTW